MGNASRFSMEKLSRRSVCANEAQFWQGNCVPCSFSNSSLHTKLYVLIVWVYTYLYCYCEENFIGVLNSFWDKKFMMEQAAQDSQFALVSRCCDL